MMFALLAAALGIAGYLITGSGGHVSAWFSPPAVVITVLTLISLHLAGGSWTRKP